MERVYDKHDQLVREHPDGTIRGSVYIIPFRLDTVGGGDFRMPDIWRHEGGRVNFKRGMNGEWREVSRKYESWYHNPVTGNTWGRKPLDPELYEDIKIDWSYL